jgi:ATP-dependent DNA ligase
MGAIVEMRSENALITKGDLEGLVVKRKDGKYSQRRLGTKS